MSTTLGFNNKFAHELISKYGQEMVLQDKTEDVIDPVTQVLTPGAETDTPCFGYLYPATIQNASAYGLVNVQADDEVVFLEAIIEPNTSTRLNVKGAGNSDNFFNIKQVKKINQSGFAVLFILLISK